MENEQKARKMIITIVSSFHPKAVSYMHFDKYFTKKMSCMLIGNGNKVMPLLHKMVEQGILEHNDTGYTKGAKFSEEADRLQQ